MPVERVILLIGLGLCLIASGFLSGSETAVVAIPRERLARLEGRRGGALLALASHPERTIGTILVANNFVNILAAALATILAVDLLGERWGTVVATFGLTAVVLVVGEITPKTLASRFPERYGLAVAPALWRASRFLNPVSRVFRSISNFILKLVGADVDDDRSVTEDDVKALALLGEQAGEIEQEERQLIEALFSATDRLIRDVMTPRVDVVSLHLPLDEPAIRRAVAETGHSRFPVLETRGDVDRLAGVLYVKDLLRTNTPLTAERTHRLLREPFFVPETAPLMAVLHEFRTRRIGIAVVLDEHGGIEGIVTAKDLVSELVGHVHDEYDPGAPAAAATGDGEWTADGSMTVDDLADTIGVELPEGPFTTTAGMFLFLFGDIPAEGDTVEVGRVRMTVADMDRRRIGRVRVSVQPPDSD
ncbi:MAG: hemolysin family protein [Acidimicrobiia bacterium]|nr:hemolysin family protein [Acidimicrobiia bacterium]